MQILKTARSILSFYKNFFFLSFIITVICLVIFQKYGMNTFFVLFWFKVITLFIIYYFIKSYKAKEFYYYRNLGISELVLWMTTFLFDFSLFILLLLLINNFR